MLNLSHYHWSCSFASLGSHLNFIDAMLRILLQLILFLKNEANKVLNVSISIVFFHICVIYWSIVSLCSFQPFFWHILSFLVLICLILIQALGKVMTESEQQQHQLFNISCHLIFNLSSPIRHSICVCTLTGSKAICQHLYPGQGLKGISAIALQQVFKVWRNIDGETDLNKKNSLRLWMSSVSQRKRLLNIKITVSYILVFHNKMLWCHER